MIFQLLVLGCEIRTGLLVYQYLGFTFKVLQYILEYYQVDMKNQCNSPGRRKKTIITGSDFVILYITKLKGREILLLEVYELVHFIINSLTQTHNPYIIILFMGQFKE